MCMSHLLPLQDRLVLLRYLRNDIRHSVLLFHLHQGILLYSQYMMTHILLCNQHSLLLMLLLYPSLQIYMCTSHLLPLQDRPVLLRYLRNEIRHSELPFHLHQEILRYTYCIHLYILRYNQHFPLLMLLLYPSLQMCMCMSHLLPLQDRPVLLRHLRNDRLLLLLHFRLH